MLRRIPRVVAADPGKPIRPGYQDVQARARAYAGDPTAWTDQERARTIDTYRDLAADWDAHRGGYRAVPLRDALERAEELPAGPCLEVGAGTGLLTPFLLATWPVVLALDLSWDMLSRSGHDLRVLADASRLPVADGSAAAVVLADAPLFADEVDRVLRSDGVVVWSNALGAEAPYHLPPEEVLQTLERANPRRRWHGSTSEAGWGSWTVAHSSPG